MRIIPALSLILPLSIVAAAGCGVQNIPGNALADNRQDVIISPVAMTGGIELNLAASGFQVQATAADVSILEFEINSPVLSGPRVQTFGKANLPADKRVKFTDLPPGAYTVKSVAKDAAGDTIGTKTESVTVVAGQTSVVKLALKLIDTELANPNGNLYIDFELIDGDVVYKPIAEPSPVPSVSPSASPSANPLAGSLGLYNLTETALSGGRYQVKGTIYNSANVALTGEIKAEFKAEKGLIFKKWEIVETKLVPVVINAKSTHDFTIPSTEKAEDVTVTITVK